MKEIPVKPDRGQRTVWLIHWSIWFFPILIGLLILMILDPLVFGLCALGWALFMLPLGLWLPAYFRSLDYTIAEDVIKGQRGVLFKRTVSMPYHKITNVDITHGPLQRKYGVGYLHCQTAGAGGQQGGRAELKMEGIRDLEEIREAIMERIRGAPAAQAGAAAPRTAEAPGSAASAGGTVSPQVTAEPGSDVMADVLAELKAIRQALEKRS